MTIGHNSPPPPPPVINKQKPDKIQRQQIPKQTAWLDTFKRFSKVPNTRYAFLWLTGGILFALFGKRVIKRREEELMIKDIENYLEEKRKKDLE
jgi:hypothetical protein